ncbi:hypothetical protein L1887_03993 [Cichorium endivia]|nr:hypothetical protein L1887_03993 [Cichorium endivia]
MVASTSIGLFLFVGFLVARTNAGTINIKTKGAKGDGVANDAEAIMTAWKEACDSPDPSQVVIPPGTYMVSSPLTLSGPCKNPIQMKANGATLKAPSDPTGIKGPGWIMFKNVEKMTLSGGIFDGQGQEAWKTNNAAKTGKCDLPYNFRFDMVKASFIRGITSVNSKHFHMNFLGCDGTTVEKVTIEAPADSLNTDGMHIGRTNGLNIIDCTIRTGDDCVSIGDGSSNIHVEKTKCGPGHGISIGSLGKYPDEAPVDGIFIKDCTLNGTDNGLRIKTWPGSPPGKAVNMHFDDVQMENVGNPILIDQEYCPYVGCKPNTNSSKVKIADVSFKGIWGTSSTKTAITLLCSKDIPCENVELADIDLKYNGKEGSGAISECKNVKPITTGKISPEACAAHPEPFKEKGGEADSSS